MSESHSVSKSNIVDSLPLCANVVWTGLRSGRGNVGPSQLSLDGLRFSESVPNHCTPALSRSGLIPVYTGYRLMTKWLKLPQYTSEQSHKMRASGTLQNGCLLLSGPILTLSHEFLFEVQQRYAPISMLSIQYGDCDVGCCLLGA